MGKYFWFMISACLGFAQESPQLCNMTFRVVDLTGHALPHKVTTFRDASGRDFSSAFDGLSGQVPCSVSMYRFQVVRSDVVSRIEKYTALDGAVSVAGLESYLTLAADPNLYVHPNGTSAGSPSWSIPSGYVLKGRIIGRGRENMWVYLRSAVPSQYWVSQVEAQVDRNGEFRLYGGLYPGPYVIYVMSDDGDILYLAPFKVTNRLPQDPIVLTLLENLPPAGVIR
jgi:hypothetical protein